MKNIKSFIIAGAAALGVVALSATEASADTVTVKQGDTIWDIAQEYNTTVSDIKTLNNLDNENLIYVGDIIKTDSEDATNVVAVDSNTITTGTIQAAPVATQSVTYAQPVVDSTPAVTTAATNTGSVYDQFIAAGGTQAMWDNIVMPESGGDVNATNGQYHGLGQTNQPWGYGSVAEQTQGMLQYAQERYGSVDSALAFRSANNWW